MTLLVHETKTVCRIHFEKILKAIEPDVTPRQWSISISLSTSASNNLLDFTVLGFSTAALSFGLYFLRRVVENFHHSPYRVLPYLNIHAERTKVLHKVGRWSDGALE